jgi:putative DNA primase/helicase
MRVVDTPPPQIAPTQFKPDDDQIALQLVEDPAIKDKLAFFHGNWRFYNGGVWQSQDVYEVRRYIRKQLRSWRQSGVQVNQRRIINLSSMLQDDMYIPDRKIMGLHEEQRRYVNLRNGMFNLDTMEFEPEHKPDLLFTTQLDFDYDPDAECPTFRKYLHSSLVHPDSERQDNSLYTLLLEALGYSMTARTDMKASFWLVGRKDSGKSTFVALLKALMGSLHATIDLTQLATNRFLLAGIVGKRVVSFTESDSNSVLPDALYKTLVGGSDEIYADIKNRDAICFRPECKVWWAMNDGQLPRVQDRSGATMRRIIIIPFNRTIPEADRVANLEQQLMAERSGIFNEMVAYLARLLRAGSFEKCDQSEERRREYIQENDTEATFIDDRAERHESYKTRGSELYRAYVAWCSENGFKPKNSNQIAKEWRRLGFEHDRSNGSWWKGLRLIATAPLEI